MIDARRVLEKHYLKYSEYQCNINNTKNMVVSVTEFCDSVLECNINEYLHNHINNSDFNAKLINGEGVEIHIRLLNPEMVKVYYSTIHNIISSKLLRKGFISNIALIKVGEDTKLQIIMYINELELLKEHVIKTLSKEVSIEKTKEGIDKSNKS